MRSAPPLADWMNWPPSSTMACHCEAAASAPSPLSEAPSCWAVAASASSARPHSAASASWSIWSLPRLMPWPVVRAKQRENFGSLDDDLLEQHCVDAARRDRRIDPARELLLEPVEPGRAVEIGRPQLTQIGLERVHHARHGALHL